MANPKVPKPTPTYKPLYTNGGSSGAGAVPTPKPSSGKFKPLYSGTTSLPSTVDVTKLPTVGGKAWTPVSFNEWAVKAGMTPTEAYNFWAEDKIGQFAKGAVSAVEGKVKPKNQISSAGLVLNTLNTSAAFTTGFLDKFIQNAQKPVPSSNFVQDFGDAIDAGNTNANAWRYGNRVKDNKDILVERFGWDPNNPLTYAAGLAGDIILDPLNLVPVNSIVKVAKGAVKAADFATTAGKLALSGEESAAQAASKALTGEGASPIKPLSQAKIKKNTDAYIAKLNQNAIAKTGSALTQAEIDAALKTDAARVAIGNIKVSTARSGATATPLTMSNFAGAAGEKIAGAAQKIAAEQTYRTRKLTKAELEARTNAERWQAAAAASLEAGRKGFVASILSDQALKTAQKYVRKDRKMVWSPTIKGVTEGVVTPGSLVRNLAKFEPTVRTRIAQEGNDWVVRSGNKVELSRHATKAEAEAAAKALKPGVSASTVAPTDFATMFGKGQADFNTITTEEAVRLSTTSPENSIVKSILKNVNKESKAAGFDNFESFIAGLNSGAPVDPDALGRVLNALDPERKIVPQAMKNENVTEPDFLRSILVSDGAQNYYDQLTRLEKASDINNIFSTKGLGFADEISAYVNGLKNVNNLSDESQVALLDLVTNPETAQTAQAAAVRYTKHSARVKNLAEYGARTAAESRNLRIDDIQAKAEYSQDISTFGQQVHFSHEAHLTENSKAVLAEEFNTVFESVAISRAAAASRTEWVNSAKAAELENTYKYNPEDPAVSRKEAMKQHAEFQDYMYARTEETSAALSDLLMAGNVRLQNSKYRGDEDFLKAYKNFGDDMRIEDVQNFVYVNISDIFKAFREAGMDNLLKEAMFPFAPGGLHKSSSLLWQNLTDATRSALEMASKGKPFNVDEIKTRLMTRFTPTKEAPKPRQAELDKLATDIANALTDPAIVKSLKKAHAQKSIGIINDYISSARNVIGDIASRSRDIWLAKIDAGEASHTEQVKIFRNTFRELLAAIDIFKIDAGPVAESIARSYAAAFMRGSDDGLKDVVDEAIRAELTNFAEEFTKMYRSEKALTASKLSERTGGKGGPVTKQRAENLLVKRETEYKTHMDARAQVYAADDAMLITAWLTKYADLQKLLDEARATAISKGVEVRNFSALRNEWVSPEHYDAAQEAEDIANSFTQPFPVDSAIPATGKLKTLTEEDQKAINATQREIHKGNVDDIADEADGLLESGAFNREGKTEADAAAHAVQYADRMAMKSATSLPDVRIHTVAGDYKTDKAVGYNPNLTDAQKAAGWERGAAFRKAIDTWGGVYGRGFDQMRFLHTSEQHARDMSAGYAAYLHSIASKWDGVSNDAFAPVWDAIIKGKKAVNSTNEASIGMFNDFKPIADLIFGDTVNNELVKNGISLGDVAREMNRLSLDGNVGFISPITAQDMTMQDFLQALPLGKSPEGIKPKTDAYKLWKSNRTKFEKADLNEFLVLANIGHAVEMAKFKKGMMEDFFVRNDYRAVTGMTRAEAIEAGYVKPRLIGKMDPAYRTFIPDDALVLPEAWESFGAVIREANALYNRDADPGWLRFMMNFNGVIKANQTIFVFGHQLTNVLGDVSIAYNMGVTNPAWWGIGTRLANAYAVERAAGNYKVAGALYNDPTTLANGTDKIEMQLRNVLRTAADKTRAFEGSDAIVALDKATDTWVVKNARGEVVERTTNKADAEKLAKIRGNKTTGIIIYKNGKPTRVNFSDADMMSMMKNYNIILTNLHANDYQGLADYLDTSKQTSRQGKFYRRAGKIIGRGYRALEKVPGDVIAWHGNIPRIAHAMKVLQSRSWNSIDDAMAEAARTVMKYHPTITGLRSSERRIGRAVIGYYTWLKTAHLTTLDMLLTRPALVTVPSKFMRAVAEYQGFEPESIGSPYKNQSSVPSYLTKSPMGMLVGKPEDAFIVKPPFMQNSVLDTFNFTWDNSKSADENLWAAGRDAATTVGGMIGPLGKRSAEILWAIDPDTNLPSVVKDSRTAFDSLASEFSIFQLLKGLGIYTPAKKDPNVSTTPITQTEKDIATFNWWTRLGLTQVYSEQNMKYAQQEQGKINKRLAEMPQDATSQIQNEFNQLNPFLQQYIKDMRK